MVEMEKNLNGDDLNSEKWHALVFTKFSYTQF